MNTTSPRDAPIAAPSAVDHHIPVAAHAPRLAAEALTIGYDRRVISRELSLEIPEGSFTVIVGPNACGKSTLLRALSKLLAPQAGQVVLDGRSIASLKAKELARTLGLLPQTSIAPDGITVADLVSRGRHPHQGFLRQWSPVDEAAVVAAMAATGVTELAGRRVDELSGGQRQRVWVAMVLAQQTPLMLLDEPTTFLDIAHQIELMELFTDLNEQGTTLVAVLHDLNQAARYGTHLVAMKDGAVVAAGAPADIVTADLVEHVFGLPCVVAPDPVTGTPTVTPLGRPRPLRTRAASATAARTPSATAPAPAPTTGSPATATTPPTGSSTAATAHSTGSTTTATAPSAGSSTAATAPSTGSPATATAPTTRSSTAASAPSTGSSTTAPTSSAGSPAAASGASAR